MRRAVWCLAILAFGCGLSPAFAQDGRLQRVREEVRGDDKPDDPEKPGKTENCGEGSWLDCLFCDDDGNSLLGTLFWAGLASPFTLPAALLGDEYDRYGYFLP